MMFDLNDSPVASCLQIAGAVLAHANPLICVGGLHVVAAALGPTSRPIGRILATRTLIDLGPLCSGLVLSGVCFAESLCVCR
jgi:hypothetical protein